MPWNRWLVLCSSFIALGIGDTARGQLPAAPGDWPGWRGADRTGVSPETGLLKQWLEGGPKLLWKVAGMGGGYSTPSVAAGRVYLMGSKDGQEYARALDAKDGKQLWETKIGPVGRDGPPSYPGPRSTPMVDGDRMYVLGSDGDLACLDRDGKVVWQKHLTKDLGGSRGRWAYSESPLLDGDLLVCTPGGPKCALAALHKQTGAVIWTAQVPEGGEAAYASIIRVEVGGVKQYIQYLGNGVVSVAAKDGKFLWRYDKIGTSTIKLAGTTNCSTPIFHDGCVFTCVGGTGTTGCALLKLSADSSGVAAQQVYLNKALTTQHGGVVRIGEYLYGSTNAGLVCVEFKTGVVKWQERSVGRGAVSAADGHIYLRSQETGKVALVEATPAGYKEKGRLDQPNRSTRSAWPHPVIAGSCLYLRDDDVLLCYALK